MKQRFPWFLGGEGGDVFLDAINIDPKTGDVAIGGSSTDLDMVDSLYGNIILSIPSTGYDYRWAKEVSLS